MFDADSLMGVKKPDLDELKEVKVKLPVKQLLRLHYLKLTTNKTFSEVVAEALWKHFDEEPRSASAPGAAQPAVTPTASDD